MATAPNVTVTIDVELTPHTRALVELAQQRRRRRSLHDVLVDERPPRSPADQLLDWLEHETSALQAIAHIAGAGAQLITDEKLTRLEQLAELVRYQQARLEDLERDVVVLADAANREAAAATAARAEARVRSARVAEICTTHTDAGGPGWDPAFAESVVRGIALEEILSIVSADLVDEERIERIEVEGEGQ